MTPRLIPAIYLRAEARCLVAMVLLLLATGCGGSGSDSPPASNANKDSADPAVQVGTTPTASGPVFFLNQVGPSVDADCKRAIAYIEQQFTRDVNPRYGIDAHAVEYVGAPDPHKLIVILRSGPAINGANTVMYGNWAYVQYNDATLDNWPARYDHGGLNLAKYPIGQPHEATDYNPLDYTQTKLDGKWWLCDWPLPQGALDAFGRLGMADFIGAFKR